MKKTQIIQTYKEALEQAQKKVAEGSILGFSGNLNFIISKNIQDRLFEVFPKDVSKDFIKKMVSRIFIEISEEVSANPESEHKIAEIVESYCVFLVKLYESWSKEFNSKESFLDFLFNCPILLRDDLDVSVFQDCLNHILQTIGFRVTLYNELLKHIPAKYVDSIVGKLNIFVDDFIEENLKENIDSLVSTYILLIVGFYNEVRDSMGGNIHYFSSVAKDFDFIISTNFQ